jgi:hypothetical protein
LNPHPISKLFYELLLYCCAKNPMCPVYPNQDLSLFHKSIENTIEKIHRGDWNFVYKKKKNKNESGKNQNEKKFIKAFGLRGQKRI